MFDLRDFVILFWSADGRSVVFAFFDDEYELWRVNQLRIAVQNGVTVFEAEIEDMGDFATVGLACAAAAVRSGTDAFQMIPLSIIESSAPMGADDGGVSWLPINPLLN